MSLETRIVAMAQAMGADVKTLTAAQGNLSALNTTTKTNLVAAINELLTLIGSAGASIDDGAGNGNTSVTWSADKIFDSIEAAPAPRWIPSMSSLPPSAMIRVSPPPSRPKLRTACATTPRRRSRRPSRHRRGPTLALPPRVT